MFPLFKNELLEWGVGESCCELTVYSNGKEYLCIATEVSHNGGESITNDAEKVWQAVLDEYGYQEEKCRFIECYVHGGIPEYSEVELKSGESHSPIWISVDIDKIMKEFFSGMKKRNRLEEVD